MCDPDRWCLRNPPCRQCAPPTMVTTEVGPAEAVRGNALIKLDNYPAEFNLPSYATPGSAGIDLRAVHGGVVKPGERVLFRTGMGIQLMPGWEAQVRSRSGLAHQRGVVVLNSPGTIDSDYMGEILVLLYNSNHSLGGTCSDEHSGDHCRCFRVEPGDRIAQLVLAKTERIRVIIPAAGGKKRGSDEEGGDVSSSNNKKERGTGGFGSTGIH